MLIIFNGDSDLILTLPFSGGFGAEQGLDQESIEMARPPCKTRSTKSSGDNETIILPADYV